MKFRTIFGLILVIAAVYFTIDYIRLTDGWRMYSWDMFTKTDQDFLAQSPQWGTTANANLPASGSGIFPESQYIFTEGWHLFNMHDWENHLSDLKDKPNIHGLEVGSWEGMSAIWALENILTHPTSTITCIDIFDNKKIEDTFDYNVLATGTPDKIKKIKGPSENMLCTLEPGEYDYIYIDGCHLPKWVLSDAVMGWELLKPGGLMIFDDYRHINPKPDGLRITGIGFLDNYLWNKRGQFRDCPRPAIDAFLSIYKPYLDVVFKKYQVVVRKK